MALTSNASKERITNQAGSVVFNCPGCTKTEIVRTLHERQIAAKYTCAACGFVGPSE